MFPAQPAPIFDSAPAAEWIAPPGVRGDAYGVYHFRSVLEPDRPPASFVVHVSADNRYGLFDTVLGIRPLTPRFLSVLVAPHPGPLNEVEGSMPHPQGEIVEKLQRTATGGYRTAITLPPGIDGVFEWRGRRQPLRPGSQQLEL